MNENDKAQLSRYLESIAAALDIPDSLHEEAVRKYQEVGLSLAKQDEAIGRKPSEIFPQGSFKLGTVIRPLSDVDQYDIDLVYQRDLRKESTTQSQLKKESGANLEQYRKEKSARGEPVPDLEPGRRCWTLTFDERFHMDVLPAIPNDEGEPTDILITDTELTHWQHSNPLGYADWFKSRMKVRLREARERVAKLASADIADVPEWKIKTPLQMSVQILKRHRDVFFSARPKDKPASILITTLAAHAYNEEADLVSALESITTNMERFIEKRDGVYWVQNPVNRGENFADKWRQHPERREDLRLWLKQVRDDLAKVKNAYSLEDAIPLLRSLLGEGIVNEVADRFDGLKGGIAKFSAIGGVPALAEARHAQAPQWPLKIGAKVKVLGDVYNFAKSKKLWTFNSSRGVPKHVFLRFRAEVKAKGPFEVRWQVVNTGVEAVAAQQLRGGWESGDGDQGDVRWESTAFAGTHWVEAFVIQNGVCVARSGRVYVRIMAGKAA